MHEARKAQGLSKPREGKQGGEARGKQGKLRDWFPYDAQACPVPLPFVYVKFSGALFSVSFQGQKLWPKFKPKLFLKTILRKAFIFRGFKTRGLISIWLQPI